MTKLWNYLKKKSKTLHELAKEFPEKTYRDLEKYRDADRREEAQQIITEQENEELKENQHKEDWKKRAQEAEGEMSILKGIETNRVKEAQARCNYLQDELDRVKRENNDLHNKVAALLDAVDPAVQIQKARESGL